MVSSDGIVHACHIDGFLQARGPSGGVWRHVCVEAGTDAAHCMVGAHYWILQRLIDEDWNLPAILIKHTYLFVVTGSAFGEAPHTTGAQTSHTQTKSHTHIIQSSQTSLQQAEYGASGRYSIVSETRSKIGSHPTQKIRKLAQRSNDGQQSGSWHNAAMMMNSTGGYTISVWAPCNRG